MNVLTLAHRVGKRLRAACLIVLAAGFMPTLSHADSGDWRDGFSLRLQPSDRVSVMYSPYTMHYSPSDEHRYVWLVGLERERADQRLSGITYFSNSFGQPSTFIYPWGKVYRDVGGVEGLYAKWSAGLLYGYVDQYKDKVPLNVNGFSPAIIPSLGYELHGVSVQLNVLAAAGLMLQFNIPLNR
ncbi:MAG: hypothetical protein RL297_2355 [Pseudomonadota bacterium]|jgi:hypothetical protein